MWGFILLLDLGGFKMDLCKIHKAESSHYKKMAQLNGLILKIRVTTKKCRINKFHIMTPKKHF